uniref:Uncharacterized protein n=1 Tax=Steinernema glaseri TaxID=37863 RepID=A0A1I7Z8S4_9BILA
MSSTSVSYPLCYRILSMTALSLRGLAPNRRPLSLLNFALCNTTTFRRPSTALLQTIPLLSSRVESALTPMTIRLVDAVRPRRKPRERDCDVIGGVALRDAWLLTYLCKNSRRNRAFLIDGGRQARRIKILGMSKTVFSRPREGRAKMSATVTGLWVGGGGRIRKPAEGKCTGSRARERTTHFVELPLRGNDALQDALADSVEHRPSAKEATRSRSARRKVELPEEKERHEADTRLRRFRERRKVKALTTGSS